MNIRNWIITKLGGYPEQEHLEHVSSSYQAGRSDGARAARVEKMIDALQHKVGEELRKEAATVVDKQLGAK